MNNIIDVYNRTINGDLGVLTDVQFCVELSEYVKNIIESQCINQLDVVDTILRLSNYLYNNTSAEILPLDDGLYDQLLELYKKYNPNYQVGSMPAIHNEIQYDELQPMVVRVNKEDLDSKLYARDILHQYPDGVYPKYSMCYRNREPITKRLVNTEHKYPQLVGTLDKCKFVTNNEARQKDVFDKPSVAIFERDFIHNHLDKGIIHPYEEFEMVGELKYDGVSVEAEVMGDTIISALSRGDTAENVATDLTPILRGYKFQNAHNIKKDEIFGIKFEAVITKSDMDKLSRLRNKSYKNCRNAIIGLFSASDAYKYRDLITLIPLATSLYSDRISELNFLNKYYSSGEYNRYVTFRGNYQQIIYQVEQFTQSAEIIRPVLPYMIDGVVISYIDEEKIFRLGRVNSVNKYSIAIKFNPKKVRTIFTGYTYNIGKSGDIIPMAHFKPCEFIGTIHNKQTIHSYARFKELNLSIGNEIDIEYVNEVITYVTKPDTGLNRMIDSKGDPEKFIEYCTCCGNPITISPTGKSAKCTNMSCRERMIMRMVDFASVIGIVGFSEESIRKLNIDSLDKLINIPQAVLLEEIGELTSINVRNQIDHIVSSPIEDYKILAALGFSNIGAKTWKSIMKEYDIHEIKNLQDTELINKLVSINGIGSTTAISILENLAYYKDELDFVLKTFNIINTKGSKDKPIIVFTGFRDSAYEKLLCDNGFDASDSYNVTKQTSYLIAENVNSNSSKIIKAKKYGIPILTKSQFLQMHNIQLN